MRNSKNRIALCIVTALIFGCSHQDNETSHGSQDTPNRDLAHIEAKIDSFLTEEYRKGNLNGNVLVVKGDQDIYERSFGYSDGSKETPLNKDHRFGIGSIYKEFPAVAIMQLQEQERLHLDDTINKYLPELPEWSEQITIKNLLQYSGGLPKIDWGHYFSQGIVITNEDIMKALLDLEELEFQPGTDYLYTNHSPFLLIKIVEHVSTQEFSSYAKEHLFAPFHLDGATFSERYPYRNRSLMAVPFDAEFVEDDYEIATPSILLSATARDLHKWFQELNTFTTIKKPSLQILAETAELEHDDMQAPLGNCVLKNGEILEHSHHGSSGNYEALVRRFNPTQLTIVILTNQKHGNVSDLSEKIRDIVNESDLPVN